MLERLAAWFLNTYVAEYVGNVVTDQLSIGLLQGAVELEKLPLKRDALHKHNLPIDIVSGYIGKLKLQIPAVRYIKSQPWVVQIDQLYVILGPSKPDKYDTAEEERKAQEKKATELAKMERQWKEEQKKKTSGWWFMAPFSLSFPSNVIANLQVIVNDIHIRYEDIGSGDSPFSLGVMISNLSAQSTDENWGPRFMSGEEREYKLMDVVDFSVYWDTETVGEEEGEELVLALQLKRAAVATQQDAMSASMMAGQVPSVNVIIKPIGGQAKLTRNCSKNPLRFSEGPRFLVDVQLAEIPVVVTDAQYCALVRCVEEMGRRWRGRRWRKWKPEGQVADNPGGWWQFAIMSVLERVRERSKRSSLTFTLHRARQSVAYVTCYTLHLTQTSVSEEVKQVLKEVEEEQSYEEVVLLRRLVMTRIKKERDLAEAVKLQIESESGSQRQPGMLQRWFPGWMSGYQGQQHQQTGEVEVGSVQEDEDELLEELGYEAPSDSAVLRDSILLHLSFSLGKGSFTIHTSPSSSSPTSPPLSVLGPEPLVGLVFSSLCCSLHLRPRVHYASFELSLGGLTIEDHVDSQTLFPVLVKPKGAELPVGRDQLFQRQYTVEDDLDQSEQESPLFSLRASQERGQHIHLHVHSKPLDIVYNRDIISQLRRFFLNPWSGERGRAYQQLEAELRSHTTAGIRHRLEEILEGDKTSRLQLSVRLDISAPHIIIPEDVRNRDTRMVIVDLGHVTFGSVADWSEEQERTLEQGIPLSTPTLEEEEDDDDEEFATPPSSPPSDSEVIEVTLSSAPSLPEQLSRPVDSGQLSSAIQNVVSTAGRKNSCSFDRYLLKLSELQVLVGSVGESWRQAVREGHSKLHLLEKFTLSIRLQRCLDSSTSTNNEDASLSLWASLPSLRFHVDEEKVHTLITCLHPPTPPPSHSPTPSPSPTPPITPHSSSLPTQSTMSIYESAYSPESFLQLNPPIRDSIYHSLIEGHPHDNKGSNLFSTSSKRSVFSKQLSSSRKVARERYQRRLLVAAEKLVSANLSIDEVLLSLSSKGRPITELNVPGVKLQFLKRPYDTKLDFAVQDLCVVDCIQTFGPEFELVVCSSGKTLLRSSSSPLKKPFDSSSMAAMSGMEKSYSCPNFDKGTSVLGVSHSNASTPGIIPVGARLPQQTIQIETQFPASTHDEYSVFSPDGDSVGLLSLSYQHLSPFSPEHPAMRDVDFGETDDGGQGEGEGEQERDGGDFVLPGEGEPGIRKVSVNCTAIDIMANQETVVELIAFFQRAVPLELLSGGPGREAEEQGVGEGESGRGEENTVIQQVTHPVHSEVCVVFERLGVRMLRRLRQNRRGWGQHTSSAQLIASIMFYRLAVEARLSNETSLEGRLEGIEIEDLTPIGRKYKNILTMGGREGGTEGDGSEREKGTKSFGSHVQPKDLNFTVHISPQSTGWMDYQANDVHVTVFVPAIHYTHSVNLVYELEMFVSEFQQLSRAVVESFSSAAVGVAKGLVNEKSQLAERIGKLSTSLAPRAANFPTSHPPGGPEIETTDGGPLSFSSKDRLYLNVCIQSPVIILPSSLHHDKCLVAYLGEITVENQFIHSDVREDLMTMSVFLPPEKERLTLKISNMCLHATHDAKSRALLVANGGSEELDSSGQWWKVLKETSVVVQIDRKLRDGDGEGENQGETQTKKEAGNFEGVGTDRTKPPTIEVNPAEDDIINGSGTSGASSSADLTLTGRICDPLLIRMPKDVFDQIKTTLNHGIYRTIPKKAKKNQVTPDAKDTKSSTEGSKVVSGSLTSSAESQKCLKSESSLKSEMQKEGGNGLLLLFASFSLPRLSLELKHTIGGKEKNFVYVSFEEFAVQCQKFDPYTTSVDLALKSIIIEDLLQEKESEYRYLLASSTKPLPLLSPVASPSPPLSLRRLPRSPVHRSHLTRPLLTLSHLMSTPRISLASESPLRSFTPQQATDNVHTGPKTRLTGYNQEHSPPQEDSKTSFATPKTSFVGRVKDRTSRLASHKLGMTSPETSFTGQKPSFEDGSTLLENAGNHNNGNHSNLSDIVGLLSIKAMFVDKDCPEFESKYNSVTGHVDVEFSSASVIINLQTWVLLLDFLGIGIPTPPPSPSSMEVDEEEEEETQQQQQQQQQRQRQHASSSLLMSRLDQSLNQDALDFGSLPTSGQTPHSVGEASARLRPIGLSASLDKSLYVSAWENPLELTPENNSWRLPTPSKTVEDSEPSVDAPNNTAGTVWGAEDKMSLDISLNVRSLTVTFNKPEHPLTQGVVSSLAARVETSRGNLKLSGSLGQASVVDLTETGAYYRERFTTTGDQALTFEILKYGKPDPRMERPFDISARVDMTSVRYLHTMRFLKENLAFCSHFPQLIDAFQRMKAMAQGNFVYLGPDRKPRIKLDVDLAGPILLIPKHAFSPDLMGGDIGHVRVTNSTRYDGEEGTLTHMRRNSTTPSAPATPLSERVSVFKQTPGQAPPTGTQSDNSLFGAHPSESRLSASDVDRQRIEAQLQARSGPCLMDCIQLDLSEVDVFSARKVSLDGDNFKIVRQKGKVLKKKGAARLYIERNLYEDFCRDVPDLHIEGTLSAIHMMLDKPQLELIKGLIDMNLGEEMEDFDKPSTVIIDPVAPSFAAEVWTGFLFRMKFVGVQLEFLQQRQTEVPGSLGLSLALFDIQDCEFSFESRSNQSKTVDFTTHAVIGYDTRYRDYDADSKPSVFSEVLRPRFKTTDVRPIQVQINVTLKPTSIDASILLNKLRLIGLFDLLLMLKSFVIDKLPEEAEDLDEVDFSLEIPVSSNRLTSHLKPRQWPPVTTPREKKPDREIRVRLSVTETDFVVVEDLTSTASNAVVLKGTVMLKFNSLPNSHKTLYTSIDSLELFSCNLDNEDESALSILDPVTITLEIKPPSDALSPVAAKGVKMESKIKVGGSEKQQKPEEGKGTMQTFEVEFRQLNFRLSYNDLKLFLAIAQSLPSLTSQPSPPTPRMAAEKNVDEALVKKLLPLGFSRAEIRRQLYRSANNVDTAANRLLDREREGEGRRDGGREGEEESVREGERGEGVDGREKEGEEEVKKGKPFSIGKIELEVKSLSVCLIDDSMNRDVPLLDLSLSTVQAAHDPWRKRGEATAVMSGDYYNRHISAWEPVLEPWRLKLNWEKVPKYSTDLDSNESPDRLYLKLTSPERLCVNITSSLIQILHVTQSSWRQDLQRGRKEGGRELEEVKTRTHRRTGSGRSQDLSGQSGQAAVSGVERGLALLHSVRFVSQTKGQRTRFVPFLLRNSTGLPLKFTTHTSIPSEVYVSPMNWSTKEGMGGRGHRQEVGVASELRRTNLWKEVGAGEERPFDFSQRSKRRHQDTRSVVVHQLLVKVAGWQRIDIPVSVDKIGIFFREVRPSFDAEHDSLPALSSSRAYTWIVFAISLSDTQKVVNVRSSLVLHNTMELPLDVKLEKPDSKLDKPDKTDFETSLPLPLSSGATPPATFSLNEGSSKHIVLPPLPAKGYAAIPLHLTDWNIRVRPQGWGTQYCSKQLVWRQATGKSPTSHVRACEEIGEGEQTPFRFCVSVQRENFPLDPTVSPPLPAHTLTLHPPLTVVNLLPYDMQVFLNPSSLCKHICKGKEIAIYCVHTEKLVELKVSLEGFSSCDGCSVSLKTVGIIQGMCVRDSIGRSLRLTVTSEVLGGTALKVSISCAYWLVNRTGLPLLFRQEGVGHEGAGQWEEHERASTSSPLLFAYQEGELMEKCSMRLGKDYQQISGFPSWCSPFRMISDSGVVRLFVSTRDGRPDREFQIGVDVRRGRRQYQNTRVVTFVARYQLENRTQYRLAYLQRHQLHDEASRIPILMPSALLAFHWPRADRDQLLNVRVENISSCKWSGGFTLNRDFSFHIHMRGTSGHSIFIRCNVTMKGATYHVLFSDAAPYPPPFRLENLSQIGVIYLQLHTSMPSLLNPGQSVPYSWDETTLPERLCLQVQGSQEVKEFDLESFGERGKLYYERYLYIAASATFPGLSPGDQPLPSSQLVLDVPQGTAVIFQRKDTNRRSQLWRMTSSRQLVHIASSTHRDMVLDIAGQLPPRGQFVPLMVKKKSEDREHRQTWRLTEDGRLLLDTAQHLCAQSPQGYLTLREGADVVLGHITKTNEGGVPPEQQLRRLRHSPGSGVLTVEVRSDGPTRVLRISDQNKKYTHTSPPDDWAISDHGQVAPSKCSDVDSWEEGRKEEEEEIEGILEIELSLSLDNGIGVSLINSVPEELLFASVDGLQIQFNSSRDQQCVNLIVQHIQVDNQLTTSHTPLLAYPTPPASGELVCSYPVIRLCADRVPHKSPSATVFKAVEVKVREMTLLLEERLLFKLLQWAGLDGKGAWSGVSESSEEDEIMNMLTQRSAILSTFGSLSQQLYFETFSISETELRVSMHTTSQLPEDLQRIKKRLGLPLVKFESPIFLAGFHQVHLLENPAGFVDALVKHYKTAVRSQAIKILGSVDFLGNPVGLVSDVASGVAGMIGSQDVLGLVRDVTHGMSDTTSKLTGTVSHVLGQATFDSSFQEEREQMQEQCQTSGDHLRAGIIGLSSGVFGGVTSIFTQPYRGAVESGVGGFITGVGKGILGTVAKPVAGLFDLASGTTAALRETTSRVSRLHPPPVRHRRCCIGPSGTLTCYSQIQAKGQEYLLRLNDGAQNEKLVYYELLSDFQSELMRVIISSQSLYFFRDSPPDPDSLESQFSLNDLVECRAAQGKTSIPATFIILALIDQENRSHIAKFRCSDERKARKIAQLINFAKNFHEEEKHIVRTLRLQQDTIW